MRTVLSAVAAIGAGLFVVFASRPVTAEVIDQKADEKARAAQEVATEKPAADESTELREISGILVDRAGFPVNRAYINIADQPLNRGTRSDEAGRFTLKLVPAASKTLIAWSQRSERMAIIPIVRDMPADRQYVFDFREGRAEGRVVDTHGKALDTPLTLILTGPDGLATRIQTRGVAGRIASMIPVAPGWTVSAGLESGESTPPVPMAHRLTVELPDLVRKADAGPEAKEPVGLAVYSGRVVDEEGRPIAGVILHLMSFTSGRLSSLGEGVTDADGRWSRRVRTDVDTVEFRSEHPDFIGWHFDRRKPSPAKQALLDGTAVEVMRRGLRVHGTVRDAFGAPVGNALVLAGNFYSRTGGTPSETIEDSTTSRTARDGTFSIGGLPPGMQTLVILPEGLAPSMVVVPLSEETKPLDLIVDRGRTVGGRIVDGAGNPVSGVSVGLADWSMPNSWRHSLARSAVSGADGRFTFAELPRQGAMRGTAVAGNGRMTMSFEIVPGLNEVGDVPVYTVPVIEGKVVDEETGNPIPRFTLTFGFVSEEGQLSGRRSGAVENERGQFVQKIDRFGLALGHDSTFAIKVAAVGYVPAETPSFDATEEHRSFEVRLRKARPIRGTIHLPDGTPADGANIYVVGPQNPAYVTGLTLNERLSYAPDVQTRTDTTGAFELPSTEPRDRLLILHRAGYAILPSINFKADQTSTLIPWARIEGTYRPGGKGRLGVSVHADAIRPLASATSRDRIHFPLEATTDAEGRFVIERVPAMQLRVGAEAGFGFAASKTLRIEEGKTNTITLADDGPPVSGKVDLSDTIAANPPPQGVPFDTGTSWVRAFRVDPQPELPDGADAADWGAQLQSVLDGNVDNSSTLPAAFSPLAPDGQFAFDALAPGRYVVQVEVRGERGPNTCGWGLLLARGHAGFTVGDRAISLPPVPLLTPAHPEAGVAAPEITGVTTDGGEFSLSKLRGKFVVLDFWAGWCVPCRAAQPSLQAIHARYENRVAFVGLNFDYTEDKAKKAAAAVKSPWPQVVAGPWEGTNPTLVAYGVETIPSIWLIDPAGKVVAKHLTVEQLEERLAAVLGK